MNLHMSVRRRVIVSVFFIILWLVSPWCVRAELTTSFNGDTLDSNLHLDIPDPDGVGTISLDTVNHCLLFYGSGADLWNDRNGLPYAWTAIPNVGVGGMWRAETEIQYNVAYHAWGRIAGLTTYSGPDGSGGASMGQEFTFGLDQWDYNDAARVQGLGDNQPGDSGNLAEGLLSDILDLRMDVTVGEGNYNTYDFYYKLPSDSEWSTLGTIHYTSTDDRVALFFKGGDMDVSFNYFNVTAVPEPSSVAMVGSGAVIFWLVRFIKRWNQA
ncbi:MAG: PEP-CTERM sorting domain-containing protein [Kiritimatiellales bacterium]